MKKHKYISRIWLVIPLFLFLFSIISGCSQVAPWERGNLARFQMNPAPHPLQDAAKQQVTSARESAAGGSNTTGGGCGCY
ncbi:DUF4266 domain-containing protein [Candidatus Nitrosacidococcus tergens]|uniref:Arginine decarboxylase n=1 Tax=Candidatus Nitrosacidococcus tergens TaxID=553981 RepID=A0A7G1Q933_9GAMM|nr:DUF4266 domain-containing protein [Candidatus Nitrosacidococcus tergens]CAB1275106.1 Arginine decarboxylase [Candidatus Nitrosacidococcus tergens]